MAICEGEETGSVGKGVNLSLVRLEMEEKLVFGQGGSVPVIKQMVPYSTSGWVSNERSNDMSAILP